MPTNELTGTLVDEPGDSRTQTPRASGALIRSRFSRALSILYFARTAVSLVWVVAVSIAAGALGPASPPGALLWTLLVLYPVTDAAATLIDIRTTPHESHTAFQRLNLAASLAAAGAIVATVNGSFATTVAVFGVWAIASGAIQLVVALRRTTLISAQWFMIISGAGSIFAGITFLTWAGTVHDGTGTLIQYSTGGALWYAIAATWLRIAARRQVGSPAGASTSNSSQPTPAVVVPRPDLPLEPRTGPPSMRRGPNG
jgi:uncharacterized membrane protein YjfL (UPF0719 family)